MAFDYPYNLTGPYELVAFANTLVNNMLGLALIVIIFGVTFLSLKDGKHNTADCMVATLWITTLSGALMSYLPGMLDGQIVLLLAVVTALATVFLWRSQSR